MSSSFNLVGKWTGRRLDSQPKVSGQLQLGSDMNFPDQLYLKMKRSQIPSGTITSMDTTAAKAIPGVVAILTPDDIKNNPKWAKITYSGVPALPYDKIRICGEEIAAVVAEDPNIAEEACQAIKVTYAPTGFVLHMLDAVKPNAPQVYDGTNGSATKANQGAPTLFQVGDPVTAMQDTTIQTFNATYETDHHQANNLVPYSFTVKVDTSGRTEMWTSCQYAKSYQYTIAGWLGQAYSRVRVYNLSCDSGFGDKKPPNRAYICGTILSQMTGRPVHFLMTHEDNLVLGNHRTKMVYQMQVGYKPDGTITAIIGTLYGCNSAWGGGGTSGYANAPLELYKIPNMKFTTYDVYSNVGMSGPIRVVADAWANWAIDQIVDEVASRLGMNPVDVSNKNNLYVSGDKDLVTGNRIASCGQPACFNQALTLSNFSAKWKAAPKDPTKLTGVVHGIGICNYVSTKGSGSSTSASVTLLGDGSLEVHADSNDLGNGKREQLAIIAAEQLGLPFSMVTVCNYDSDGGTDTGVTAGSTQTKRAGNAVGAAAIDARNQLLAKAATSLGTTVDKLTYATDGSMKIFLTADPTKSVTFASLSGEPMVIGVGHYAAPTKTTQQVYGTAVVEVDVDTDTGIIKATDVYQVQDVGRVITPDIIKGQAWSGVIQGINLAIQEDFWPDVPTGKPIMYSHLDAKLMLSTQTPRMQVAFVENAEQAPDSVGNFGAKGTAEPWVCCLGAVTNAVANATGARIRQLPMSPEKVLAALGKAQLPPDGAYKNV
jgi:CO/xanthine dehydrogenase Mo-binding subunit